MSETLNETIQQVDFNVNILQALLWEYNLAPNLQGLLEKKQSWYSVNQTQFWEDWVSDVFDLRTCNLFGLTVWAIILGIPLTYISAPNNTNTTPFGFGPDSEDDPANTNQNFFASNFASNQSEQFNLTLQQKRLILRLRYRQMIARGTIPETNKILADLLVPDYGPMYMIDGYNMTETIVCVNGVTSFLGFLFTEFDLIPRPQTVKLLVRDGTYPVFGFGPDVMTDPPNFNQNFDFAGFTPNSF